MIDSYTLQQLLTKYGIDYTKVITKNSYILDKGEYKEIEMVLNYLINTLHISPHNIEKCPSILYFNVYEIKSNYEFLKETNITISDIDTCLHILSTKHEELVKTYYYILNNYGVIYLQRITSILSVPLERIQDIETFSMPKDVTLSACISRRTIDEIRDIIHILNKYNIEITGSVFNKSAEEIEKIVQVCNKYNIEITGSVFLKSAEEIEKIVQACNKYNIEITGSVFNKSAEEIEKIVQVCNKYNIEITGSVFLKSSAKLLETINWLYLNYGEKYLTPLIVTKDVKHLEKVFPYLENLGVLEHVINSASILSLTYEEIKERKAYLDLINEPIINSKNKFNSVFGLSRKNFKEKIKGKSLSE